MVDGLAARLQRQPDDPAGWARLICAYGVLGDKPRAGSGEGAGAGRCSRTGRRISARSARRKASPHGPLLMDLRGFAPRPRYLSDAAIETAWTQR